MATKKPWPSFIADSSKKPAQPRHSNFFKSPTVKLVVGPKEEEYYIHKALLASISVELEKHAYDEMVQGPKGDKVLHDIEEETIEKFLEWAYMKVYSNTDTFVDKKGSNSSPSSSSETLMRHAKVYVFSDRFNIPDLKILASDRLQEALCTIGQPSTSQDTSNIISLLGYLINNLPDKDGLQEYTGKYAIWCLGKLRENPSFWASVKNHAFAELLLKHVDPSNARPPWHSLFGYEGKFIYRR